MMSLLLPSRSRPANILRLYASLVFSTSGPWELVIRLDDDDPAVGEYPQLPNTTYIVGPRTLLSSTWNECYLAAEGPFYCHAGDDIIFRTPEWDTIVTSAFPADRIAFVHGDDLGGKGHLLGTHGFLHRRWIEAVETFCPPYFSSDYNDLWFNTVAEMLGRRVFVPIVTEHMHPAFDKGPWDRTHQERWERHQADKPERIWDETEGERRAWAEKLRALMS